MWIPDSMNCATLYKTRSIIFAIAFEQCIFLVKFTYTFLCVGDGLKISTKKAKITDSFKCEANDLYNVFVTEEVQVSVHINVQLRDYI